MRTFVSRVTYFIGVMGGSAILGLVPVAEAAPIKPRFVVIFDTSGSMSESLGGTDTNGDGSPRHPGCDLDGNGIYDDSRLFQAKAALTDTIVAFGSAEFALARFRSIDGGQACTSNDQCRITFGLGSAWDCVDPSYVAGTTRYCVNRGEARYGECDNGNANDNCHILQSGGSCDDTRDIYMKGFFCGSCVYPACKGGNVVVPFPTASSNFSNLLSWIDGEDDIPTGNRELRATGYTPIASSIDSAREWLTTAGSSVGAGSGVLGTDAQASCRSYNIIMVTDGDETCGGNGPNAAEIAYNLCSNGGTWDAGDNRCEIAGSPSGTAPTGKHIKTYAVGFAVSGGAVTNLNNIAAQGGTNTALLAANRAELTARLGDIIASSIPIPRCDCDTTCDDEATAFPEKGQSCSVGVGRCKVTGVYGCNVAGTGVTCSATGAGLCGLAQLSPGPMQAEACGNTYGCPAGLTAAECADEDCDGQVDEGLSCQCASMPELCNGLDDNCNGMTDELASVGCGLDLGECRAGTTACVSGQTQCQNAVGPMTETCDNLDNDCDGITDSFGESCYPAATAGCAYNNGVWSCLGICQTGTRICLTGNPGACSGMITPQVELACDGFDNDCDGQTDEGFNVGGACGPGISGVGLCSAGTLTCIGGAVVCQGGQGPSPEICDGFDNDCDGFGDNLAGICGVALGICRAGSYQCQNGVAVCVQPNGPGVEVCNGLDDDCNGAIDDNVTDADLVVATACSSDVGVCKAGVLRCVSGQKICSGGVLPGIEVCNNRDDDCDGCLDCDPGCLAGLGKTCPIAGAGQACGLAVGLCRAGQLLCIGGLIQCIGDVKPGLEICDALDNDCNGFTDETDPESGARCYPAGTIGCDVTVNTCAGECQFGAKICQAAAGGATLGCASPVTPKAEVCDTTDNDCDGATDEDFNVGADCDNGGTGLCLRAGKTICNARGDGTTCSVAPPQIVPEVCDGMDNDCDGLIDEAPVAGAGEKCGSDVGECQTGVSRCEIGKLVCTGLEPKPEICNGLDDDCDGEVDDALTPPGDACLPAGLPPGSAIAGECRPGQYVCTKGQGGVYGWQCRGGAGPTMEVCDGKDNNCDGNPDEQVLCQGGSACEEGECNPRCQDSEFPCPADRTCKAGFCIRNPCINVTCAPGFYCGADGDCIDRCAGVVCAEGATCKNGICRDCHTEGCQAGFVCFARQCVPDNCETAGCTAGQACRRGACVNSCVGVACAALQRCEDGACVADTCAGIACTAEQYCDPATAKCEPRTCGVVSCLAGFACVETTGRCAPDPCTVTRCPQGSACRVAVDGRSECTVADGVIPTPKSEILVSASGGGLSSCACRIGAHGGNEKGGFAGAWLLVVCGLAGLTTRRRARKRGPPGTTGGAR